MQHFNVPAASFGMPAFEDGLMFDGSSIRGFQSIHESDMKLIPDPATAFIDPFRSAKTLVMNFSIRDPFTNEPYSRDPRNVAAKAEAYFASTGIADTVTSVPKPSSTSSTTFASRPTSTPATTSSTRSKGLGTPVAWKKAATAATRPATRAATSRFPRSTTTPIFVTRWSPPSAGGPRGRALPP